MEKYIEEMNNIHAPEALILKTLARVHEEEQKVNEEKSESGIQENQITGTEYREAINKDNVNNVIEFVPSEDTKKRNRKELIRKFIIGGSTVAAAAIVLIIALNVSNLGRPNYSSESTAPSDSAATEAAMADEAYEEVRRLQNLLMEQYPREQQKNQMTICIWLKALQLLMKVTVWMQQLMIATNIIMK